jgi:LysM repeat protein
MPEISIKPTPTARTQPTKTTTPAAASGVTQQTSSISQSIVSALTGALKSFYQALMAPTIRPTATIHQAFMTYATSAAPRVGGGTPPPAVKPTLPSGVFEPMVTSRLGGSMIIPMVSQVEEGLKQKRTPTKKTEPSLLEKWKAMTAERPKDVTIDLTKAKVQPIPGMAFRASAPSVVTPPPSAGMTKATPQQVLSAQAYLLTQMELQRAKQAQAKGKTIQKQTTSQEQVTSGAQPQLEEGRAPQIDITQIPFVQDMLVLSQETTKPTSQIVTNVPAGVEIQIYRDPLGGSTPFFGHVIQPGETLSRIAQQYGVSVEDILRLNRDKTDAIKSRDLIIAGKEIRIPVVQRELKQPALLGQKFASADEINQKAKESLQQPQPQLQIDDNKLNQLILEKTGVDLSRIDRALNQLIQLSDPNFYVDRYNQLLERTGLSKDIQALADIRSIMEKTKQDVLEEAAKVGGLVTESQVAEVVNFRHGILKAQYQALADAIEAKEKMIDNIMKYTAMDRKTIADLLESQLKLEQWKVKLAMDAIKWDFDNRKELRNLNLKKLENYAESGQLHTASSDFLYHFVNPESPLYAGITVGELRFYIRLSQEKARQRELNEARTKQLIQKTLEDIQRAREKHPLEMQILEEKLRKLREDENTLSPETF